MTSDVERQERRKAMAPLSEDDVERIADCVKGKLTSEFDIDPKEHYDAHQELVKMANSFNGVQSIVTKVLVAAVAVGGAVMIGASIFGKKFGS